MARLENTSDPTFTLISVDAVDYEGYVGELKKIAAKQRIDTSHLE